MEPINSPISQQQNSQEAKNLGMVEFLFKIVTKATHTAKVFPMAYSLLLIILIMCNGMMSFSLEFTIEIVAFATIPFTAICLILSYNLKLCKWYRLQSLTILSPLSIPLMRTFCPDLNLLWARIIVVTLLSTTTLICIFQFCTKEQCKKWHKHLLMLITNIKNKSL